MDTPDRSVIRVARSNRDLRYLLTGLAVSTAGDWIYGVALVVLVFEETRSPAWVAATGIMRLAPYIVFGVAAGALADRYDRRQVMIGSDLVRALLMFGLAGAAALGTPVIVGLAIAFLTTAAGTPYGPAMAAVTPSLVAEDDLGSANAALSTVDNTALVIGPAVGGLLVLFGSTHIAFMVNGVTFLVSGLATAAIRTPPRTARDGPHESFFDQIRASVITVVGHAEVVTLVLIFGAASFVYGTELVFLVLVAEDQLGMGSQGVGFLQAAIGAGGLAAAGITGRLASRVYPLRALTGAALGFGLPLAGLAFLTWPPAAYGLLMLSGASVIVIDVLSVTLIQRSIPPDLLARAFGLLDSIGVAAIVAGSLLTPPLLGTVGLGGTLVIVGLFLPAVALAMLPRLRRLEATPIDAEIAERVTLLRSVDLFHRVPAQALEGIAQRVRELTVGPGETVVRQGEPADRFYVVRAGTLKVFSARDEAGIAEPVRTLGAGDYFGEIGIIERVPRTATVRAQTPCTLYAIEGDDFLAFVNRAPTTSATLLDVVTKRLVVTHPARRLSPGGPPSP